MSKQPSAPHKNTVRIIGGKWRSRKLSFAEVKGLRPSADRVRETLFNWLMPYIHQAHCLDLFAGSGALGFEALSRGAQSVIMIDQSRAVIEQLRKNAQLLATDDAQFYCAQIPAASPPFSEQQFDIVFLDPPFNQNLIATSCAWLQKYNCLKVGTLIYIEAESKLSTLPIPDDWEILRSQKAGQVRYYLCRVIKKSLLPQAGEGGRRPDEGA